MFEPTWSQAEPPDVKPVRGGSGTRLAVMAIAGVLLLLAAFFAPIPVFYAYLPGPVRDVERLVEVADTRTYSSEGQLLLTTVSVDPQVTLAQMVESAFDDATAIVMKEDVTQGQSLDQLIEDQRQQMQMSKQAAQEVALAALGLGEPTGDGARVVETFPESPAANLLEPGDVIVSVEGRSVGTTCEVGRAIGSYDPGRKLEIGVKRDGRLETLTVGTIPNVEDPSSAIIGVFMEDVNRRFEPGLEVEFDTGKIGGPSGGLMMTLALYDQLTPDDITGGRTVAGTGTIACDGGVGAIGGIEQKVAGAEEAGAEIFLAPSANAPAARKIAGDIEVVSISTFDEALRYLEGLPSPG
jgi:Lon-like protease